MRCHHRVLCLLKILYPLILSEEPSLDWTDLTGNLRGSSRTIFIEMKNCKNFITILDLNTEATLSKFIIISYLIFSLSSGSSILQI